jgi:uncharacterized protein (TIGR02145 family)
MRTKLTKLALMATLAVAITLTLSCSGGDDGGGSPSSSSSGGDGSGLTGTSGTFPDSRDGKSYKWVKIGEQYWMAENLNHNATGSVCYDNLESNCTTYGKLYDWATAMTACPTGWHLPSEAEWGALMQYANPSCSLTSNCDNAGTKLKSASGWTSGNGTDDYGFAALPGGARNHKNGSFEGVGEWGGWWTSTEFSHSDNAYLRSMRSSNGIVRGGDNDKEYGVSIRCLKDNN